jgi:hypothetical protein
MHVAKMYSRLEANQPMHLPIGKILSSIPQAKKSSKEIKIKSAIKAN